MTWASHAHAPEQCMGSPLLPSRTHMGLDLVRLLTLKTDSLQPYATLVAPSSLHLPSHRIMRFAWRLLAPSNLLLPPCCSAPTPLRARRGSQPLYPGICYAAITLNGSPTSVHGLSAGPKRIQLQVSPAGILASMSSARLGPILRVDFSAEPPLRPLQMVPNSLHGHSL